MIFFDEKKSEIRIFEYFLKFLTTKTRKFGYFLKFLTKIRIFFEIFDENFDFFEIFDENFFISTTEITF